MTNTGPEAPSSITLEYIFEKLHPRLRGYIREVSFDPKAKHEWEATRVYSCQVKIRLATLNPDRLRRCADAALIIRENLTTASAIRHNEGSGLPGLFEMLHPDGVEKGVMGV